MAQIITQMRCINFMICRSFNNWTKSMLINEYMDKIRRAEGFRGQVSVLDLGCGKGGDLTKWHKAKVDHVVGVDIAATSIEQCKDRYPFKASE